MQKDSVVEPDENKTIRPLVVDRLVTGKINDYRDRDLNAMNDESQFSWPKNAILGSEKRYWEKVPTNDIIQAFINQLFRLNKLYLNFNCNSLTLRAVKLLIASGLDLAINFISLK